MKVTYYQKDEKVLVTLAGDDFLAGPEEVPDATLYVTWFDCPGPAEILVRPWLKSGVKPVDVTLDELKEKGGIFEKTARVIAWHECGQKDEEQENEGVKI